jgi:hypothetical protein
MRNLKKIGRINVLFVVVMLVSISFSAAFSADIPDSEPETVTICQISSGNSENPRTTTISKADLDAHLAAGDTIGPCEADELEKLDHFMCYPADGRLFFNDTSVELKDQFGEEIVKVHDADEFCNPTMKIHDGNMVEVKDPDAHLTRYVITASSVPDRKVLVTNQFGEDQPITVSQPFALFVPTQKFPHQDPTELDHFKCYEASGKSADAMVYLEDQFQFEENVSVFEPFMLCNPVEKTHNDIVTPIKNPNAHLVCYVIKGSPFHRIVNIRNQFSYYDYLDLGNAHALCVPSEKKEPPVEKKLDHFKCYTTYSWLSVDETIKLKDQFGADSVQVHRPTEFCNPVEKTHEGKLSPITNPDAHLTRYAISSPSVPDRNVLVTNQFGENKSLVVSQPFSIMVPTQKFPHQKPTDLDHFKCYEATGQSINARVDLRDQFNVQDDVVVFEPFALCNPVQKSHAGVVTPIEHPDDHLVCYLIQGSQVYEWISIGNQFTNNTPILARYSRELCVPSEKVEIELEEKLDHFKCYYVLPIGWPPNEVVDLRDQFGGGEANVGRSYFFCNPVQKTHRGEVTPITNPDAHLKMSYIQTYGRNPFSYLPPALDIPDQVEVSNQFGEDQKLNVGQPLFLATPTQKFPHQPPSGLDHFKCYYVSGNPIFDVVDLKDQFQDDRLVSVYYPFLLCNPVVKTHNDIVTPVDNPEDHLVCYTIRPRVSYRYAYTNNQFGTELLLMRFSYILCVPSIKKTPPPDNPFIQELCGEPVAGFDGGMVLPAGPGTGLFRNNPSGVWPDGRPRRPCGDFVPIDGPDITLTLSGAVRFRIAYRPAGAAIPPVGTAPGITTQWNLLEWNGFACVRDGGPFELETDGSPQQWMDVSDYLNAKSGALTGCGNSGLRWAVWDSNNTKGYLPPVDPNGHYVVWVEWDDGVFLHREPLEHHVQFDNTRPKINELKVTLPDGNTTVGACGDAPGNEIFKVYADFEDDYYWRYRIVVKGGSPPATAVYGWHNYYDGTIEVLNTDTTGTVPDATTVHLRDINLTAGLGASFTDCCYLLELQIRDSAIRHSFNHKVVNNNSGSTHFWATKFITFEASPP